MILFEVPEQERAAFCRRFGSQYSGETIGVEITRERPHRVVRTLERASLAGLDYDPDNDVLNVHASHGSRPWTLDVANVAALTLLQPEGAGGSLEARTRAGDSLFLRFDRELIAGLLDGVASSEDGSE